MTPRDKRNRPGPPPSERARHEDSARLFERLAVIFLGVGIAARPLLPDLKNSSTLLLHAPIVAAAFLWLVARGMRGRISIARSGVGAPLIIYAAVIALSPIAAGYKYATLQALPVWLTNLLLFFLVLNFSADKSVRRFFIAVFLASAAVVVFHGIYQRAAGLEEFRRFVQESNFLNELRSETDRKLAQSRIDGDEPFASFTTANILATFLLVAIPVFFASAVNALKDRAGGWKAPRAIIILLALAAGIVCLYLTGSAAACVVFVAEIIIFPLIFFRGWLWRHKRLCAACLVALIAFCAVAGPPVARRLAETRSVNYRFGYWAGGWGIFKDHWLTGVGLGNFRYYYYIHKPAWAGEVQNPHNCFVQAATEFGVIGLLAFAAIWALFIVRILRSRDRESADEEDNGAAEPAFTRLAGGIALAFVLLALLLNKPFESFLGSGGETNWGKGLATVAAAGAIWAVVFLVCNSLKMRGALAGAALATGALGFFLHAQFDFGIEEYATNQACWLAVALALAAGGARLPEGKRIGVARRVLLILVGFGAITFYVFGPMMLAIKEDRALAGASTGGYAALEKAIEANPLNAGTHRDLAEQYYRMARSDKAEIPGLADAAINQMREAIRLNPNDFAYHWRAATMLQGVGLDAEALDEYNLAVECYPTKPALYVYRAWLEDRLGMKTEAKRDIEETARLLRENRMPDGSVRHTTQELDTSRGLPGHGSEEAMCAKLRGKHPAE